MNDLNSSASPDRHGVDSTCWSMVLAAGAADDAAAREALSQLCRTYWPCVYGFVRRRGADADAAEDLTQEFFASLIERRLVAHATPDRGRFRAFLFTAVQNFLINEWQKRQTRKRGGGHVVVPLDDSTGRHAIDVKYSAELSPADAFDRQWAVALLHQVLARLAEEYSTAGKASLFEILKPALTGVDDQESSAALGRKAGLSATAVRAAVYRLRQRYRVLLRDEVARTVATPADVEEELRDLFRVLDSAGR